MAKNLTAKARELARYYDYGDKRGAIYETGALGDEVYSLAMVNGWKPCDTGKLYDGSVFWGFCFWDYDNEDKVRESLKANGFKCLGRRCNEWEGSYSTYYTIINGVYCFLVFIR